MIGREQQIRGTLAAGLILGAIALGAGLLLYTVGIAILRYMGWAS